MIYKNVSADRSAEVHCHFENRDKDLVPELFVNAEIEQTNYQAYVLPEDAAVNFEKQNDVFIRKDNNQFEMIPMEVGTTQNGMVEIKAGTDNELLKNSFIKKGAYNLRMKLKNTADKQ